MDELNDLELLQEENKELLALRRAMPIQRLLGSGMDLSDYTEFITLTDEGLHWSLAGEQLGDESSVKAAAALSAGLTDTARIWFLRASACYRVGQMALPTDTPEKKSLYRKLIEAFNSAAELHLIPIEHLKISFRDAAICGWLMRPQAEENAPVVIVMGGFDGWREEYYVGCMQLVQRGIAVYLMDGPGQGETRLFENLYASADIEQAYNEVVTFLKEDPRVGDLVGIWGNSMGGYLAARVSATCPDIAACCVNGGSWRPAELVDRYPRFIEKIKPLFGTDSDETARRAIEQYSLDGLGHKIACPLMVMHGTPDQVFLIENARRIFDEASSMDKEFVEFENGDHCIYNHTTEKNCKIADWFSTRLLAGNSP